MLAPHSDDILVAGSATKRTPTVHDDQALPGGLARSQFPAAVVFFRCPLLLPVASSWSTPIRPFVASVTVVAERNPRSHRWERTWSLIHMSSSSSPASFVVSQRFAAGNRRGSGYHSRAHQLISLKR